MSALAATARRALLLLIAAAAYGWQDRLRSLPGPRIALALPLREPSHQAGVPLVGLLAVWLAAFAIAAVAVPPRTVPRPVVALVRGVSTFAAVLAVQAISLELVRQATFGFAWSAALTSATPYVAGGCAAVATMLATPRRQPVEAAPEVVASVHPRGSGLRLFASRVRRIA